MAAVHQGFGPSATADVLPTPGFFSAAIGVDENQNVFEQSFKAGTDPSSKIKDSKVQTPSGFTASTESFLRSLNDGSFSPLFGFSSQVQSPAVLEKSKQASDRLDANAPYSSNLVTSMDWTVTGQLGVDHAHILPSQEISPPQSAKSPPTQWPYGDGQDEMTSSLQQILTKNNVPEAEATLGQITPPSDDDSSSRRFRQQNANLNTFDVQTQADLRESPKRRRGKQAKNTEPETKPSKRQRKSTAQSKNQNPGKAEEDVKRNKFLERNRVAASKCRQKKKEWTGNLESRARELQQDKAQLALMVSSLKDEMIFLKGELLKHTSCDCAKIRQYLNQEATNFASKPTQRHADPLRTVSPVESPFESSTGSRNSSLSTVDQSIDHGHYSSNDGSPTFDEPETYDQSVMSSADHSIEALLNSTMDESK